MMLPFQCVPNDDEGRGTDDEGRGTGKLQRRKEKDVEPRVRRGQGLLTWRASLLKAQGLGFYGGRHLQKPGAMEGNFKN